jgi:hypothetical protein
VTERLLPQRDHAKRFGIERSIETLIPIWFAGRILDGLIGATALSHG